jgi:Domain of unknown function (DUF4180)
MIPDRIVDLHERRVLEYGATGPRLCKPQDALDIIGNALQSAAQWVLLPVARIADGFFDLKTGLAGEAVQKFANYDISLAIVGDVAAHVTRSGSLRDFIHEANLGRQLWFLPDRETFESRLQNS